MLRDARHLLRGGSDLLQWCLLCGGTGLLRDTGDLLFEYQHLLWGHLLSNCRILLLRRHHLLSAGSGVLWDEHLLCCRQHLPQRRLLSHRADLPNPDRYHLLRCWRGVCQWGLRGRSMYERPGGQQRVRWPGRLHTGLRRWLLV